LPYELPVIGRPITTAVHGPSDPSPDRRPESVRRTATLDLDYPDGLDGNRRVRGRARDLLTFQGETKVLADDVLVATVTEDRSYESLFTFPDRPALQAMVGPRGTKNSRRAMAELVPQEREAGTPLFLLLDDLPAIALISGQINIEWLKPEERTSHLKGDYLAPVGICSGFQEGSNAIGPDGKNLLIHQVQNVGLLTRDDDPLAWHKLQEETSEPAMRRARRIDVWIDESVRIDAFFQDSCTTPHHGRVAVHEYQISASADVVTGELLSINADPRILPFDSCPGAASNVERMLGIPLRDFRQAVLDRLPGTLGCTHLSDALRALAEVPMMIEALT
jgi:hypothetical protein